MGIVRMQTVLCRLDLDQYNCP